MGGSLIRQAQLGDKGAFEELAAESIDRLYSTAILILGDRAMAEDAVQEALLIDTLEAQGSDVTLEIMPDSSHEHLSDAGWDVFLAAFSEIGGY